MAGSVSFGGIGSGIDTESIIKGLSAAATAGLSTIKTQSSQVKSAVSAISDIGSLLGKLKSASEALDTERETGSYKASSSSSAITASANGSATPGRYAIKVNQLASEQRTYSNEQTSDTAALNLTYNLGIKIGSGTEQTVNITATDSLSSIAGKINGLGSRVSASVVFTDNKYALQVRGLDTGKDNAITFTNGDPLGLSLTDNTKQKALDSELEVDGFKITRPTNQISSVIPGVTLAVTQKTTDAVTVSVDSDPDGLKSKLTDFVNAYNAVVNRVHSEAGFGSQKANNVVLAGDSTLRNITSRLSTAITTPVGSTTSGDSLASIGIKLASNGTLSLDGAALDKALQSNPSRVLKVIAGNDSTSGVMDVMRDLAAGFTQTGTGVIGTKTDALNNRAKTLDKRIETEQARIDQQAEMLRKQFTQMDSTVAGNNSLVTYLQKIG
jgi:flagellar hook-associated protein 2